jgi:hypothetical protein
MYEKNGSKVTKNNWIYDEINHSREKAITIISIQPQKCGLCFRNIFYILLPWLL